MPISLRMPPVLRPQVGGARQVEVTGATLREALDDLFTQFPAVRDQIVDAEGQGNDARVQVNFGREGLKWLAVNVAKLETV